MDLVQQQLEIAEKIEQLEQQKQSLQAKLKSISDQLKQSQQKTTQQLNEIILKEQKLKTEIKSQTRKQDTRRKILLGAFVLHQLPVNPRFQFDWNEFEQFLNHEHKTEIHRQKDLELFKDLFRQEKSPTSC